MKLDAKNILMKHTARDLNFPYRVHMVGHVFNAPLINQVESTFPQYIEIALRLRSHDESKNKVVQWINNVEYHNKYPHALIKYPGAKYTYKDFGLRDVFYFCYDLELFDELKKLGLFDGDSVWDIELTPQIEFIIQQIRSVMNCSQEAGMADRLDLYCFELLSELLLLRRRPRENHGADFEIITKIDSYLRFNVTELLDMNQVAEHFNLSKSTFFRYWKKYFSTTPGRYFTDLKLKEACRRLSGTSEKINAISNTLNFQDSAYFCLVFRKKYHMTPLAYRKKYQSK